MKYLGFDATELEKLGAIHTAREIAQQPWLWQEIWNDVNQRQAEIQEFFSSTLPQVKRIILAGAGTSAFIGLSLRGLFQRNTNILTEAIATTDIVSYPKDFLDSAIPTLMISFARSGNSPESVAVVALADEICKTCFHFIITCDGEGKLARYASSSKKFILTLPRESNDQSLAMTSSYSGMLLAGVLVAKIRDLKSAEANVHTIIKYAQKVLSSHVADISAIAKKNFKRAVFLGDGPFFGTAQESHLKLQELSGGQVICKNDSYLGFRHGPKAVVDETTLMVYIISSSDYAWKYEKDLIDSMKNGTAPMAEITISESALSNVSVAHPFFHSDNGRKVEEEFLAVCFVLPGQLLGFFKSLHLGLRPDAPSANGAITRVVEGVKIYAIS